MMIRSATQRVRNGHDLGYNTYSHSALMRPVEQDCDTLSTQRAPNIIFTFVVLISPLYVRLKRFLYLLTFYLPEAY